LEYPQIIEPDKQQIEKIGLLNEFISAYNILKMHEADKKIKLDSSQAVGTIGSYNCDRLKIYLNG
jgi:DNA repair protein RadC